MLGLGGSETAEDFPLPVGEHVALHVLGAGGDEVGTALAGDPGLVGEVPVELGKAHGGSNASKRFGVLTSKLTVLTKLLRNVINRDGVT